MTHLLNRRSATALLLATAAAPRFAIGQESPATLALRVLDGTAPDRLAAIEAIQASGDRGLVAPMIDLIRYSRGDAALIGRALDSLTGEKIGADWFAWRLWQEGNPEITPFLDYAGFKSELLSRVDENFRLFLQAGSQHQIRLEEIVWGGVAKDGIPALVEATMLPAAEADYLEPTELVFGVSINGDTRAYPFRILDWHEMANDTVGGVPIALAYCTLCGSGIVFDTSRGDQPHFEFGSSGLLYRSNKLMYDRATNSLWNQFTGRPVVGQLADSDIELPVLPVTITSWENWSDRNPDTKVLSLDTGYQRDYTPGRPYGAYFASSELMFPARLDNTTLAAKEFVFALRVQGHDKAWPLSLFKEMAVINDQVGDLPIVLIGDPSTRTVVAYESGANRFEQADDGQLRAGDTLFEVEEEHLIGPSGQTLARLPGHIAYWFAYQNYLRHAPLGTL